MKSEHRKGIFGLGTKYTVVTCDQCSTLADPHFEYAWKDYCSKCAIDKYPQATHSWGCNFSYSRFDLPTLPEHLSSVPTHISTCSDCGAARIYRRENSGFVSESYFNIGSSVPTGKIQSCPGGSYEQQRKVKAQCLHSYVKIFSADKTPTQEEIRAEKAFLRAGLSSILTRSGYEWTEIDMLNKLFGKSVWWCSKCGYIRTVNRLAPKLPISGLDSNWPEFSGVM